MKQFCYVLVSTERGGLHSIQGMLEEGWQPVRETPLGCVGGVAYGLVLLEKEES